MNAGNFAISVKRAIAGELGVAELLAEVETLARASEPTLVVELYRIWIQHNTSNPLLYAVHFNFGVVLTDAGDLKGAEQAFSAAVRLNPTFMPPYINLGNVMERLGAADQAVQQWTKVGDLLAGVTGESISHKTTALKQIGRVFETAKLEANAEEVLRRSLEISPRQRDVTQHWIALRQSQCKWPAIEELPGASHADLMHAISPLSLAAHTDDPIAQIAGCHRYNTHDVRKPKSGAVRSDHVRDRDRARKLRIGYVSSDLREHAVGFLMSEVFELHNRTEVESFAYYCGISGTDLTKQRFQISADHWRDINSLTDEAAAALIEDDKIDILVDLNGYTKDARLGLFALRPAPIIVNWLGFPGTMASGYHNYIVADPFIIPESAEVFYSENVVRLPCYQPNDRKRVVAAETPSRADMGLPENSFVYCCFNGTQKITRSVFDAWMSILRQVPDGVLWLLSGIEETNERIRQLAEAAGISRDRIIFASRRPNPEHLARYALADLFLDTSPYGAHTTASDALWIGVPVITVPGRSFASRVCGSLVKSAGLGDLICEDLAAYVERSVALAKDPGQVAHLKRRLRENRDTCTLFDTPLLVRSLEALYRDMWRAYIHEALHRPDLTGLDTLQSVACEIEPELVEGGSVAALRMAYQRKCIERNLISFASQDPRLSEDRPDRLGPNRPAGHANHCVALHEPRVGRAPPAHHRVNDRPASGEVSLQ